MRCPAGRSLDADPRPSLSSVSQKRNREEGMWNSIQVGFTEHLRNVYKSVKMKWIPMLAPRNCPAWQISIFQNEKACALAIGRDDGSAAGWMFWMPKNSMYILKWVWICKFYYSIEKMCKDVKGERKDPTCLGVLPVWRKDAAREGPSETEVLKNLSSFCLVGICHLKLCCCLS